MSSPFEYDGTRTASPFSSKNVDVLNEDILVKIDKSFKTANYNIEYSINNQIPGIQIPLLFVAFDYLDSFKVWVDDVPINVLDLSYENGYRSFNDSLFENFYHEKKRCAYCDSNEVTVYWDKNFGNIYKLNELKYFSANLTTGIHKIRVEYKASVWVDLRDWVKEYSFRYSLSPAKHWKSFKKLSITIVKEQNTPNYTTNLGVHSESLDAKENIWTFNGLPADYIKITYKPEIGFVETIFTTLGAYGLSIFVTVFLLFIHFKQMIKYRKKNKIRNVTPPVLMGGILIPIVVVFVFCFSYNFIDLIIGEEASSSHNDYRFIWVLISPIFSLVYFIICWQLDVEYFKNRNFNK